jgi:hypothetical protein
MDEIRDKFFDYATKIKDVDPMAQVVGSGGMGLVGLLVFRLRPALHQFAPELELFSDQAAHGGWYYLPWLLDQLAPERAGDGPPPCSIFSACTTIRRTALRQRCLDGCAVASQSQYALAVGRELRRSNRGSTTRSISFRV